MPCMPDTYIVTNHSLLKRKSSTPPSVFNISSARKINASLVLAEPPTPNDVARELMPRAKIAKLISEASDSTKALLRAFDSGDYKVDFLPPPQKNSSSNGGGDDDSSEWDLLEAEKEEAEEEAEQVPSPCELPQTKEQQTAEHILRENAHFLYNLQVAQYQRLSGIISKAENRCATKLARNIADLGIAAPPAALVSPGEADRALRESDLVNDLVPIKEEP